VLAGTLRGSSFPRWVADHLPVTAGLVERWYAWEVFRSLPFLGLLTLIAVAICICTINRAPGIWASIARPTVATTHGFLRNAERIAAFTAPAGETAEAFAGRVQIALRSAGYRAMSAERNGEQHVYADRYSWGKLGTFPFHLGLILVLVGAIVGGRFGFRELEFVVPEGVTRPVLHGTDLSIRVDDFSEEYRETGIPMEYRSDLTILAGGQEAARGSITVNNPMTYRDLVIYQSGFGQAVRIQMADPAGNLLMDELMPLGPYRSKVNPDAPAAVLDIPPAGLQLTVIAPDGNPGNAPELDEIGLRPGQMYLQLRPLNGLSGPDQPIESRIDQGQTVRMGGYDLTFVREKRFTVLQVARNPGIPIFLAATAALLGGLAMSFYFPHRRVRGILAPGPAGATLTLAPLARRDWSGQRAFDDLIAHLERGLGIAAARTDRNGNEGQAGQEALPAPGAAGQTATLNAR
ncbi:MAG: cytochrome c biogenesis protein ResB, partial [Chloroflexota bacterium]